MSRFGTGVRAGVVAGALSGIPSTVHALATGGDVLESSRAAGTILLPEERSSCRLLAAGAAAHLVISVGWGTVLALALPRRHPVTWGAAAGLGIAVVDLGLAGRRFPRVRALPRWPQVVDHIAFGALAGAVVAARR